MGWQDAPEVTGLRYADVVSKPAWQEAPEVESQAQKIGAAAFPETFRRTFRDAPTSDQMLAAFGSPATNIFEAFRQIVPGMQPDQRVIEANRVMAQEAPVSTIAGNAALYGLIPAGRTVTGAAALGGGIGALQPVETWQQRLTNTSLGAAGGASGQVIGQELGRMKAAADAARAMQKSQNAPRDAVLAAAIKEGYVVPPSSVNPSFKNQVLESISGKIASAQVAASRNQSVTDKLARRAVGLADDVSLTSEAMQQIRRQAYQAGYEPVASAGKIATDKTYTAALDDVLSKYQGAARSFPGAAKPDVEKLVEGFKVGSFDAGDALKAVQSLRDDAADAFRRGNTGLGKAQKDVARTIEDQIERSLASRGEPAADLLKGYRDARQLMAKAHTVEEAIIEGGGTVNARKLAQRVQAGKPMSDELKTAGEFANLFPRAAQPPTQVAGPAVHNLKAGLSALMGGGGAFAAGPFGATLAGIPFVVPPLVRARMFSKGAQEALIPSYEASGLVRMLEGPVMQRSLPGVTAGALPYWAQE